MATRINLEQLRAFLVVARTGGVHRAADELNLTQPAVSARIQALEASLSAKLFQRSPRGMVLTKRGETLRRYAEQFLQLAELVERDVIDPDGVEGTLRVGASETIVQTWLPDFVSRVRDTYPLLSVEISVDISANLRDQLLERTLDLALLMGPVSNYCIENIELPPFRLAWYCATSTEIPDDPSVLFQTHPVLTYGRKTRPYREIKEAVFERYGPEVRMFASSSLSAGMKMVTADLCVGAFPTALADQEVEAGRIIGFDPGWEPNALHFTASHVSDPPSPLTARCASIALEAAMAYAGDQ